MQTYFKKPMNRFAQHVLLWMVLSLISSCVVGKKKYDELNKRKSRLETDLANCGDTLTLTKAERDRLAAQLDQLNKEAEALRSDTAAKGKEFRKVSKEYEDLSNTFEGLLKKHAKLENFSAAESDRLTKDLLARDKQLKESQRKNDSLAANLKQREERVKELEKVLADKEKAVNDLKQKVSNALLSFKDKDLSIQIKNGKVYVSLAEQLLFKSGSTEVDPVGVEALKKLATALKDSKDVSVMVEGHTDDVPLKPSNGMKDNWDLSVLRATSITRILIQGGVAPVNILPSGRGEFMPVVEGKNTDARKQNRRTEIILTPKLDELFKVLESN
jgi:chemotaxis protein MotB